MIQQRLRHQRPVVRLVVAQVAPDRLKQFVALVASTAAALTRFVVAWQTAAATVFRPIVMPMPRHLTLRTCGLEASLIHCVGAITGVATSRAEPYGSASTAARLSTGPTWAAVSLNFTKKC